MNDPVSRVFQDGSFSRAITWPGRVSDTNQPGRISMHFRQINLGGFISATIGQVVKSSITLASNGSGIFPRQSFTRYLLWSRGEQWSSDHPEFRARVSKHPDQQLACNRDHERDILACRGRYGCRLICCRIRQVLQFRCRSSLPGSFAAWLRQHSTEMKTVCRHSVAAQWFVAGDRQSARDRRARPTFRSRWVNGHELMLRMIRHVENRYGQRTTVNEIGCELAFQRALHYAVRSMSPFD